MLVAAATASTAFVGPRVHQATRGPDQQLLERASATFARLYTFSPQDSTPEGSARRSAALAPLLTGRLLADFRGQGPNVALASAVELQATSTTTVSGIGVGRRDGDSARLLVFAEQKVSVGVSGVTSQQSAQSLARWLVLRKVGGTWLLADVYPVGISG